LRDFELDRELERARNLISQSGRLIILNTDRYNTNLQRTVEEASFIDGPSILTAAAEQVAAEQLKQYFTSNADLRSPASRLKSASALFQTFGFGAIDFSKIGFSGGRVIVKDSYFASSWLENYGKRNTPGCFFTAGFIAGAIAAAYEKTPGDYIARERRCISAGARQCEFDVEVK
jgi:predicted hydrocarbon binding protein